MHRLPFPLPGPLPIKREGRCLIEQPFRTVLVLSSARQDLQRPGGPARQREPALMPRGARA